MANINELLTEHVTLEVECLDRLYLNGYIPQLQTGGQLVNFLVHHRGNRIPSPVLLGRITSAFKTCVENFAAQQELEIVHFERDQRKDDIATEQRKKLSSSYEGVFLIGVAQEKASAFKAAKRQEKGSCYVGFDYDR
jgi:hypothetical protein